MEVTTEDRVASGAQVLDLWDSGWFEKIDLSTLDMGSGHNCGDLLDYWQAEINARVRDA